MNVLSPQIAKMKQYRNWMIDQLASYLPESVIPNPPGMGDVPMLPSTYQDVGRNALNFLVPQPEDTLIAPAELRPNFRSPQQIQALRRLMAEEQKARGPLNLGREIREYVYPTDMTYPEIFTKYTPEERKQFIQNYREPDPIDQILRGSWYHGMSEKARGNLVKNMDTDTLGNIFMNYFGGSGYPTNREYLEKQILSLPAGLRQGFPISRHDAQSVSNKLGEPAGISLSLNPTVSGKFAADENIFRVMPLYGGPPTQRTVNLMTPEGRNALNDAYDAVANNLLQNKFNDKVEAYYARLGLKENPYYYFQAELGDVGNFNQSLSNQLQSQGYRGILYNPKRWDEYEMLMLDPKYALPLDYRKLDDYTRDLWTYGIRHNKNFLGEQAGTPTSKITPQAAGAINNIQDIMASNHSRLGDIYAERSWWDRLTPEVKEILLQDNPYNEQIIKKLKGE